MPRTARVHRVVTRGGRVMERRHTPAPQSIKCPAAHGLLHGSAALEFSTKAGCSGWNCSLGAQGGRAPPQNARGARPPHTRTMAPPPPAVSNCSLACWETWCDGLRLPQWFVWLHAPRPHAACVVTCAITCCQQRIAERIGTQGAVRQVATARASTRLSRIHRRAQQLDEEREAEFTCMLRGIVKLQAAYRLVKRVCELAHGGGGVATWR